MRYVFPVLSMLALAACASPEAGTEGGVGFQSYSEYLYQQQVIAEREAAQRRAAMAAPVAPAGPAPAPAPASGSAAIAADAMAALRGPEPAPVATPPLVVGQPLSAVAPATTMPPAAAPAPAPAAPVAAPAPAPVAPAASGGAGSDGNIAAFALATSHPIGQQVYRRSNPFRQAAVDRACARYPSDAMAQEAFLKAGGPERDRLNLDPDGDGYACKWDPAPFRLARQGN